MVNTGRYQKVFLKMAPFSIKGSELELADVSPAYQILDQFHSGSIEAILEDGTIVKHDCLVKIRAEAKQLQVPLLILRISSLSCRACRNAKNCLSCMSRSI